MLMSEAVEAWLAARKHLSQRTLNGNRSVAWSLFRFVGKNLSLIALQKLHPRLGAEWLQWLAANPPTQALAWTLPRDFSRDSVARFLEELQRPARAMPGKSRRRGSTVHRYWNDGGRQLCAWLGQPAKLTRRELPRGRRLPPWVPEIEDIAASWRDILTRRGAPGEATPSQRRRVVLTQAFLLLTGMRKGEALLVEQDRVEGCYLLVPGAITKTRVPRILCINAQAMGIAAALRGQLTFGFAAGKRHRLLGWPYAPGTFEHLVERCGPRPWEKPQQVLRQRCADWLRQQNVDAEQVQLGHGGGDVVQRHYLDTLRKLPAIMDQFALPAVDVPGWTWPAAIAACPAWPRRLYAEYEELMDLADGRRAA
jgi:integrase